jgi:hypothetical protein
VQKLVAIGDTLQDAGVRMKFNKFFLKMDQQRKKKFPQLASKLLTYVLICRKYSRVNN